MIELLKPRKFQISKYRDYTKWYKDQNMRSVSRDKFNILFQNEM